MRRRRRCAAVLGVAAGAALAGAAAFLAAAGGRARLVAPAPTYLVRDCRGAHLTQTGAIVVRASSLHPGEGEGFGYWPLERVPEKVAAACLAIEDRRFGRHLGVDPLAVMRAARQNLAGERRVSGASTIAMQVARMQRPGRRSYSRKALEAAAAVLLTLRHGRESVLAHYLRIVPFGNRIHGIAYAARRYLDKPACDLSWAEAAFLAAIPQAPGRMNPYSEGGRRRAIERGRQILGRLRAAGTLADEDYAVAMGEIGRLAVPALGRRPWCALHAALRLERLVAEAPPSAAGPAGGLVHSTLDLEIQAEVAALTEAAVEKWRPLGAVNAASLVVENEGNRVRAYVGSIDYYASSGAGAIDYAAVPRSTGSTLKPFLYALALERGAITPATVLDDLAPGPAGLGNADRGFLGPLLPRQALANSRNVPAFGLLRTVGLDNAWDFLGELGLHDATTPARTYGLSLATGALPVPLEALAGAYTVLAHEGRWQPLAWFEGQGAQAARRLCSEDTARRINLFLSEPMARLPSFPRMGASEFAYPVAVKTGTSSEFRDAWAVAYSRRYLAAVWVGRPDNRPMNALTGQRSAAVLAAEIMGALHGREADGRHDLSFPPPRGTRPMRLCAVTGRRATPACDRVLTEWLRPDEEPVEDCPAHVRLAVDRRDGRLATAATPARFVEQRGFLNLEPRYAVWAAAAGLPRPPLGRDPPGAATPAADPDPAADPTPARIEITSPADGARLARDPETPPALATLALEAVADPPAAQIVWYVDGRPFQTADYPFSARWPLQAGEHVVQARLPAAGAASPPVRFSVW